MVSGNENGERTAAADRPPSMSEGLWDAVPEPLRQKFLEAAAMNLRRGVHPDDTVGRMLEENGIKRPLAAPSGARKPPARPLPPRPAPPPSRPRPPVPALTARTQSKPADEASPPPAPAVSGPLHPYGSSAPPVVGDTPRGVIGAAIHKSQRLGGNPGKAAAAAEASVLAAIASDPAYAFWLPEGTRALGARIPASVAAEIAPLVAQEAERVIEDVRRRAEQGDPSAAAWIDPDGWSGHLDDAEASHPAPR